MLWNICPSVIIFWKFLSLCLFMLCVCMFACVLVHVHCGYMQAMSICGGQRKTSGFCSCLHLIWDSLLFAAAYVWKADSGACSDFPCLCLLSAAHHRNSGVWNVHYQCVNTCVLWGLKLVLLFTQQVLYQWVFPCLPISFKLTSDEQNNSLFCDDRRSKYVAKPALSFCPSASPTQVLRFGGYRTTGVLSCLAPFIFKWTSPHKKLLIY